MCIEINNYLKQAHILFVLILYYSVNPAVRTVMKKKIDGSSLFLFLAQEIKFSYIFKEKRLREN